MKRRVKIGVIGLGQRGSFMIENPIIPMKKDGVDIVALSDPLEDRLEAAAKKIVDSGAERPFTTTDYHELLKREDVEAALIAAIATST